MRIILLIATLLYGLNVLAQDSNIAKVDSVLYLVDFKFDKAPADFKERKIKYSAKPIQGAYLEKEKNKVLQQLYALGYIETQLLNVDTTQKRVSYQFELGQGYEWKKLGPGNVDEGVLSKIGFRDKLYFDQPLAFNQIRKLFKEVITYYENNGYPFASIRLDSVKIENNEVSAQLLLLKNQQINIDTIKVIGSSKLSKKYLYNYIGIQHGDPYNEEKIREVETRIQELPFVSSIRPSDVEFFADRTSLNLYLNHKKANYFDGIIGFLPDEETGELLITGDIKIQLKNALNKGEEIELNWRRLQTQTQELFARMRYPFLFNSPFGVEGFVKIYRRDTTFSTLTTNLNLQYIFKGGDYVQVFWENDQSNLISTYNLDIATTLPEYADVRTNSFGLGFNVIELDYRLNPRSGIDINVKAGFGSREIRKNPKVNPEVYDSLALNSNSYKSHGYIRGFIPLWPRNTFMIGCKAGLIANDELFTNELYRIGGLKTLRGFDEESIFASSYTIFTLEYRYQLEKNSYLQLFYDQAWYENRASTELITDTPMGFGAGISFETKIGIFSLSYALGQQFNNPIQLRGSKVHFGFVNYF